MSATPYGAAPVSRPSNGLAVASLVLGIIGIPTAFIFIGGLLGLIAVILGIVALGKIKRGQAGGKGLAIGGIVTGVIAMLLTLLVVLIIGSIFSNNMDNFNNLGDCLNNANTPAEERACEDEFERNFNNP